MSRKSLLIIGLLLLSVFLGSIALIQPSHATTTLPITFQTTTNYAVSNSTAPLLNMTLNPNFSMVYDNFSRVGYLESSGKWTFLSRLMANISALFEFSHSFANPYGIAISNITNHIYVSDSEHSSIKIFTMNGTYLSQIAISPATPNPLGLYIVGNRLYAANGNGNNVLIYDINGTYLSQIVGPYGFDPGDIIYPTGIAVKGNNIYFSDEVNVIEVFDRNGTYLYRIGSYGTGNGQLQAPKEIFIKGNTIYIADSSNSRIAVFDINGTWLYNFPIHGGGNPYGINVNYGCIYTTDWTNNLLQVYTLTGTHLSTYSIPGTPKGISIQNYTLYVACMSLQKVAVFSILCDNHFYANGTHLLENGTQLGIYVSNQINPITLLFKNVTYSYFTSDNTYLNENHFGLVNSSNAALNWYAIFNISGNGWLSCVVKEAGVHSYYRLICKLINNSIHTYQIIYFQNNTVLFLNDNNVTKIATAISNYKGLYIYLQQAHRNRLFMTEIDSFPFIQSQIMQNYIIHGTPHTVLINSGSSDAVLYPTHWINSETMMHVENNDYVYFRYQITDINKNSTLTSAYLHLYFCYSSISTGLIELINLANCPAFPNSGTNTTAYPIDSTNQIAFNIPSATTVAVEKIVDVSLLLRNYIILNGYSSGGYIGLRISVAANTNSYIFAYGYPYPYKSHIIYSYYTVYHQTEYNYTQFYQTIAPYFSVFQRDQLVNIVGERFNYDTASFEINISVTLPFNFTYFNCETNANFSTLLYSGYGKNQSLRLQQASGGWYTVSSFNSQINGYQYFNIRNLTQSHAVTNQFWALIYVNYVINILNPLNTLYNISFPLIKLITNETQAPLLLTCEHNNPNSYFYLNSGDSTHLFFHFEGRANAYIRGIFTLAPPIQIQYTMLSFNALATYPAFEWVAFVTDAPIPPAIYSTDLNPVIFWIGNNPANTKTEYYHSWNDNLVSIIVEVIDNPFYVTATVQGYVGPIYLKIGDDTSNTITVGLNLLIPFMVLFAPTLVAVKLAGKKAFFPIFLIMTFVCMYVPFIALPIWIGIPLIIVGLFGLFKTYRSESEG